jgi:L-glutamine-phosphate cytidylyltransferase
MQAVILAAGSGSRLTEISHGLPKCLIPVGEKPLIQHQLEALSDAGIGKILVIVGYKADEVRKVVGNQVTYIENDQYEDTNSLYSLSLASEWVKGPFVLMNCDVLFHPDILHRIIAKGGNALAYDSTSSFGQEQTKVAIQEGRIVDIGKDLPTELSRGENLGIMCFNAEGSKALFASVKSLANNGWKKSWVIEAVRSACRVVPIKGVNIAGLPWVEIDFPSDYNRAQKETWPAIEKSQWKKTLHWRRTKWFALGLVAIILIIIGWVASSSVSEPKISWSTVSPLNNMEKYTLSLPTGNQQWWLASSNDTVKVSLTGPSKIRLFVRPILEPDTMEEQYVIEVSVNGEPLKWKVFKSKPQIESQFPDFIIGKRNRLEFEVPPGMHTIQVRFIAGKPDKFLTRIRIPEMDEMEDEESGDDEQ